MKSRKSQQGTALFFALMVLAILSIGTTVLWKQLQGNLQQHRIAWNQEQARQLAEGGLETALAQLRNSAGAYRGEGDVSLGGGTFSVVVTPGDRPNRYILESTGHLENDLQIRGTATLRATLTLGNGNRVLDYSWVPVTRKEAP